MRFLNMLPLTANKKTKQNSQGIHDDRINPCRDGNCCIPKYGDGGSNRNSRVMDTDFKRTGARLTVWNT